MAVTTEIAPNVSGVSIFAESANLQFKHFLPKDDEPLLFYTGLGGMHAEIRETVSRLINVSELRHISFSHFRSAADKNPALYQLMCVCSPSNRISRCCVIAVGRILKKKARAPV